MVKSSFGNPWVFALLAGIPAPLVLFFFFWTGRGPASTIYVFGTLPIVFCMIAVHQSKAEKAIHELEARVQALEARASSGEGIKVST